MEPIKENDNVSNFEILPQSFEIPLLQKMFTKEQLTQKLFEFGLSNGISFKKTLEYIQQI